MMRKAAVAGITVLRGRRPYDRTLNLVNPRRRAARTTERGNEHKTVNRSRLAASSSRRAAKIANSYLRPTTTLAEFTNETKSPKRPKSDGE